MDQYNEGTDPTAPAQARPVVALREVLVQTVTAVDQSRSVLAAVDGPGHGFGKHR